jgi:hypothetical protein
VDAAMSFLVVHMDKFKRTDIKGIQFHHQRERESQTNLDIDKSKSRENYELHATGKIDFLKEIDKKIAERVQTNRKIRKDAVLLNEILVTSDKDFFDQLPDGEERRFFEESYKFLADRYGKENVIHATVHKDEKTPHMHLGIVPITADGRLSSKSIFNPKELKALQNDFHRYIRKKGFDLDRGIEGKQKHVEPTKYKIQKLREKEKELEQKLQLIKEEIKEIKPISDIKAENTMFSDKVKLSKEDFNQLKIQAAQAVLFRSKNQRLKKEVEKLNRISEKVSKTLKEEAYMLQFQLRREREKIEFLMRFIKEKGLQVELEKYLVEKKKEREIEMERE